MTSEDLAQKACLIKCSPSYSKWNSFYGIWYHQGRFSSFSCDKKHISSSLQLCPMRLFSLPQRTSGASHSTAGSGEQLLLENVNVLQDPAQTAAISQISCFAGHRHCVNAPRILVESCELIHLTLSPFNFLSKLLRSSILEPSEKYHICHLVLE